MHLIINTDGASRGNPGPASYGFVIKQKDGPILHEEGKKLGIQTNNFAEYSAVLSSLQYVLDHYSHKAPLEIEIITDSQLIAEQLSGNYKIKHPVLITLYQQIRALETEFAKISYRNVPRAENFIADRIANQALDR